MGKTGNRRPEDRAVRLFLYKIKCATQILSSGARHFKKIRRWRGYTAEGFENGKCDLCYAFRALNCVASIHKGMPMPFGCSTLQGVYERDPREYDELQELPESARNRYRTLKSELFEKFDDAESRFERELKKALTRLRIPLPPQFLHDFGYIVRYHPGLVGNVIFANAVEMLERTIVAAFEEELIRETKPASTKRYPSALKPFFEAVYDEIKRSGQGQNIIDVISDVKTVDRWEKQLKPYKCRNNDKTLCSYYTTWLHKNHPEAVQVRTAQRSGRQAGRKANRE